MLYFGKITTSDPKITRKLLVYNKIRQGTRYKFQLHEFYLIPWLLHIDIEQANNNASANKRLFTHT